MESKQYVAVKDSGKRQEFDTGSRRDTCEGKARMSLISPVFMERLGMHCANGADKYGDNNWMLGQPCTRYADSALRHLYAYLEGDRSEDHMAALAWNAMGIIHTEEMVSRGLLPESLSDLPCTKEGTVKSLHFLEGIRKMVSSREDEVAKESS